MTAATGSSRGRGRTGGALCRGTALCTASRTSRRCTPNCRATPWIVPIPNSYSRRICSNSSTVAVLRRISPPPTVLLVPGAYAAAAQGGPFPAIELGQTRVSKTAYRVAPTAAARERLGATFDQLFATRTGYHALDDRIAKTRAKRCELLQVLEHPEVPLHNNPAELGARRRVRKRDVSFGPRTAAGVRAWDTFQTLVATTQKLGVSFYAYVRDRLTGAQQVPMLDDLIAARAPA